MKRHIYDAVFQIYCTAMEINYYYMECYIIKSRIHIGDLFIQRNEIYNPSVKLRTENPD